MSGKKKRRRWEYQISCAGFVGRTLTEQVWIPAGVSECNFMARLLPTNGSLQLVTAARAQVASRQPGSTVSRSFCGIHPCLMQILRACMREQLKENENDVYSTAEAQFVFKCCTFIFFLSCFANRHSEPFSLLSESLRHGVGSRTPLTPLFPLISSQANKCGGCCSYYATHIRNTESAISRRRVMKTFSPYPLHYTTTTTTKCTGSFYR